MDYTTLSTIDLTGNWHQFGAYAAILQTAEPEPQPNDLRTFRQRLALPAGHYAVELEYDADTDRSPGHALHHNLTSFAGLAIDGVPQPMALALPPGVDAKSARRVGRVEWTQTRDAEVELALSLCATRPFRTRLHIGAADTSAAASLPASPRFRAVRPEGGEQVVLLHGIPFCVASLDVKFLHAGFDRPARRGLRPWQEGGLRFDCGGVAATRVHLAGMIHSYDCATGAWYSKKGDHSYSHFVGDRAGTLVVEWADGGESDVPLIFGLNLWYGRPWDINWNYSPYGGTTANYGGALFGSAKQPMLQIRTAVHLVDGERTFGGLSNAVRYVFSLNTDGRRIAALRLHGTPELTGYPLVGGITVEVAEGEAEDGNNQGVLLPLPALAVGEMSVRAMPPEFFAGTSWQPALTAVQRLLYANIADLPSLSAPVVPLGYFGPSYDFAGPREALFAASFLYHNGPECAAHIADSGTGCSSSTARQALAHYCMGMGIWRRDNPIYDGLSEFLRRYREHQPGDFPGRGSAWSRGVGELLREAVAFGYDKFADSYVDWMDRCLFGDANPPHWVRCPGNAKSIATFAHVMVGDVEESGNRENDGHGICMWGRYMAWHWGGRTRACNETRWAATAAAAEWIVWQMATEPIHPAKGKDVLYTNSECAHGDYDIYSSYNCLHGLKLYIRLADQLGKVEEAARWRVYYARLRQGILDHLVDDSPHGPIWHVFPHSDWQDHAHGLVHLHLATEGDSYTPLDTYAAGDALEQRYLAISRNSYRHLMVGRNYDCLRMYGYGQGMMLQAALLLDEMADAEAFMNLLVSYCYLPNMEGWICPEGIVVHRDRQLYVPVNGYMGQDSHVADATKALRVMLGVDDNDPAHLRLVPRFPASWSRAGFGAFPALLGSERRDLGYELTRDVSGDGAMHLRVTLAAAKSSSREDSPHHLSLRLGPFPADADLAAARVTLNGRDLPTRNRRPVVSGDRAWLWMEGSRDLEIGASAWAGEVDVQL